MKMNNMNILLVNPWIYDFAAYDLWMKPWGLLKISAILRKAGFEVSLIDAMDRHHPCFGSGVKDDKDGTGKFYSVEVRKPAPISHIPRTYRRYGMPAEHFIKALPEGGIDLILVSSGMTYWYPGVFEAIKILREKYPKTPIVLGGVYATLCSAHAREKSGADVVLRNDEHGKLADMAGGGIDLSFGNILNEDIDYGFYGGVKYAPVRATLGCPFDCSYCAQKELGPSFMKKNAGRAVNEIRTLYDKGIKIFAFYDDALLYDGEFIKNVFAKINEEGIKASFYTPNGLHARFLTGELAAMMKQINFINPIISLETADERNENSWHEKVTRGEFMKAVESLNRGGYGAGEYTAYILLGAPSDGFDSVKKTIDFAHSLGARVSLSEYSPVPGTEMAKKSGPVFDEPLLQNNSVYSSVNTAEWEQIHSIKNYARRLNSYIS